jgi:hypothetical protein
MPRTKPPVGRAPPFRDPAVAAVFSDYPPALRRRLLSLRRLIFATAAKTEGVGPLEEALRWGEPAYLTSESKSGSTVRIDAKAKTPGQYAIYFHCQSNLVGAFRRQYPGVFRFEGNRAIVFDERDPVPTSQLAACIAQALTHHRAKRRAQKGRSPR